PLEQTALQPDDGAVRQQRVEEHAMTADGVHAEDHGQARRTLAPDHGQPAGLGFHRRALAAAPPAPGRVAARVHLLSRAAIAPDAREVSARRLVAPRLGQRDLDVLRLVLHLADALEVLVLPERRLDPLADHLGLGPGGDERRGRAVAELEAAFDRLRRAVDHLHQVFEAVARVERDQALALGVDAPASGAAGHLR